MWRGATQPAYLEQLCQGGLLALHLALKVGEPHRLAHQHLAGQALQVLVLGGPAGGQAAGGREAHYVAVQQPWAARLAPTARCACRIHGYLVTRGVACGA